MTGLNYKEARKYIEDAGRFSIKLGLERTEKILEILGNPHKKLKCIHIAGTNGKGSITSMMSSVLSEAGYKVGMYTSPYIEEFEERIQINGVNISKDDVARIITKVSEALEQVSSLGYDNPTQFEIITCAGFLYFYEQKVDYALMEVGLGGRLDSTNVIVPILSVISSISYDHMNILGDTLGKIAYEKAGIIKKGVPLVLYPQEDEVIKVIEEICIERKSEFIKVPKSGAEFLNTREILENEKVKTVQNVLINTGVDKYNINLSLLGTHQLFNCSTALYAIEKLKDLGVAIDKNSILEGLLKVKWKGRFEVLGRKPLVVIDGAHNIDGIRNLKKSVDAYLQYKDMVLILGILADKQVGEMIKTIVPMAKKVICVTPHNERAELSLKLMEEVKKYNSNCIAIENYKEAYESGISYCNKDDLLLICGSLYMVGDMRKAINN